MNENVLEDRTIVVTRPESRALELTEKLEELGAKPLAVPSIRFSKMADSGPWDDALSHRDLFTHIIFTSGVAVETFMELCSEAGIKADSWLGGCRVGAIGAATGARLEEAGIPPDLIASTSNGAELAREFIAKEQLGRDSQVLIPGSNIARPELAVALSETGVKVTAIPIYQTRDEDPSRATALLEALDRDEPPHAIVFASPSALSGFLNISGDRGRALLESRTLEIISLGPTTSEAIRNEGLAVSAQADRPSTEGLVEALRKALDQ